MPKCNYPQTRLTDDEYQAVEDKMNSLARKYRRKNQNVNRLNEEWERINALPQGTFAARKARDELMVEFAWLLARAPEAV